MNLEHIEYAAEILKTGGVIAYPTESCFGLGCDPRNVAAIRRILNLKRRQRSKGLIIISDHLKRLSPFLASIPAERKEQILKSWPGPNTWLLPCSARTSIWLRGDHDTIAVRVTAHPVAAALCRFARTPIVSTSANRRGRRMLRSEGEVVNEFGSELDYILAGRVGRDLTPSTIRHGVDGRLIRG